MTTTRSDRTTKGRTDVFGLIWGILLTTLAGGFLWKAFGGPIDSQLLKVAAPIYLVVIGVVGLLLSRNQPPS